MSRDASWKALQLFRTEKAWISERKITRKEAVNSARDKEPEKPHPQACAGWSSQSVGTPLRERRPLVLALRSSSRGRLSSKMAPRFPAAGGACASCVNAHVWLGSVEVMGYRSCDGLGCRLVGLA